MKTFASLFIVVCLVSLALGLCRIASAERLQADDGLRWYRGNLHTHSHWSDGNDYLEMIAAWYGDHGYQFVVFTDHNVIANTERWINVERSAGGRQAYESLKARFPKHVQERISDKGQLEVRLRRFSEVADQLNKPGKFLLIQGEEISAGYRGLPIHLNASNLVELIEPLAGDSVYETIQNNIRAVIDQRRRTGQPMIVHLNHPNFGYAVTAEDIMQIRGDRFFEIYNGHPMVNNSGDELHPSMDRVWDIVLTRRVAELGLPIMYGLAVDDSHNYHDLPTRQADPGRGWVNVLCRELTAKSLIQSLEAGRFYSSSGVTLRSISSSPEQIAIEIEPKDASNYLTEFIGTRTGYDASNAPVLDARRRPIKATRRYSDEIGEVLAKVPGHRAVYRFTGDEIYVRARVSSTETHPNPSEQGELKRAWCQPVLGPAAGKQALQSDSVKSPATGQ